MKAAIVAFALLGASLVGCSQDAELEKARADAAAAKTELAKVKAQLDLLNAQLAAQDSKNKSAAAAEEAVRKSAQEFFDDLNAGRFVSAYRSMSAAYGQRVDRKGFDLFIEKHPGLKVGGTNVSGIAPLYKVRKLSKENSYECDYATLKVSTPDRAINVTLRLIEEEGRWKVDEFVEVKESKW